MELRLLTKDNLDDVISNVKSITIVEDRLIVRADITYTYYMSDVLFYQCYEVI